MNAAHAGRPLPDATRVGDAAPAPRASWLQQGDAWVLTLDGEWRDSPGTLPEAPVIANPTDIRIDAQALRSWDAGLASSLWQQLDPLARRQMRLDLQGLPQGLQQIVSLALGTTSRVAAPVASAPGRVATLGANTTAYWGEWRQSLTFVGEVLYSVGRLLRGTSDMRFSDLAWQIEQTGPRSLPIVALVSFLVGLIVAYMGAAQLQRFGAQSYIADLVTVGVVREVAALLVGIVLAGRVGAAFAAQIGSMRANEEVDALATLGVNPIDFLVLPRVLALLIVGPMLWRHAAGVRVRERPGLDTAARGGGPAQGHGVFGAGGPGGLPAGHGGRAQRAGRGRCHHRLGGAGHRVDRGGGVHAHGGLSTA